MKNKPLMFRLAYGVMQRAYNVGGKGMQRVAAVRLAQACGVWETGYYDGAFYQGIRQGTVDAQPKGPK